ncbi:hypothetical protein V6N11_045951 [Hibiscus sabdariffa]|uniref:Uncharacterized protein n=1 Tax=Hibiscus sabdariffa TaxID=183260 RepID=A0ABR2Q2H6_9ROSI
MRSKRSTEKAIGRMHVCDAIAEVDKAKGPFKQCNKCSGKPRGLLTLLTARNTCPLRLLVSLKIFFGIQCTYKTLSCIQLENHLNVDMVSEIRLLTVVIFDLFVSSHLLPRVAGFIILIPSSPNVPVTLSSPSTPEPNNVHSFPVALASETNHNVFITESNPEVSPVVNVSNAPLRKSS